MSEAFLQIVNMSISASWLVIAVLLLRLVLKKAPKWVNVLLWGFVAVRLICPISFESALSLIPSAEPIPEQVIANLVVDVPAEIPGFEASIQDPADTPVRDETGDETGDQTNVDFAEPEKQGIPVVTVLTALWAVGVGAMLVYTAVSYLLLRRRVATAVRLENNIYQSENVDSPFVLGIVKAKIYLPFRMDSRDLAHVIAHEQAHIRRKDHWWKPFGFVLLAIHWFNPLMWVGYILLCRDIELACDEKVIREMDNETKADYTEALVACSVNRRRIAACPLAFGEVGVKERVKTVMNYKKPAFWIVIAAVALCIVVAVCFLTNPKDYGPQVGNPQMLEFPGVEWFVTPDELKEALNITEDQIVDETTDYDDGYGTYELSVKNMTLFGEKVDFALFTFKSRPDFDLAFNRATVMFAKETDMLKLKEEVSEIYGPGVGETYTYYLYNGDERYEITHESEMAQTLEYLAESGPELYELEENPFKEAVDDPEYMTHLWVTENSTSVIPEEVVAYFKSWRDQPINDNYVVLQDDDTLIEMLDQMPWVSISMGNRNSAGIRAEAGILPEEQSSYYTNNYMDFSAQMLWRYLYSSKPPALDAAEEDIPNLQVDNPSLLEFPGLKWGMTPEEVKAALDIKSGHLIRDERIPASPDTSNTMDERNLYVADLEIFGSKVTMAVFTFISRTEDQIPKGFEFVEHTAGEFVLQGVKVFLDEETDMEKLEQTMTAVYGPGVGGVYQYTEVRSSGNPDKTAINANPYVRAFSAYREVLNDPGYREQMWVCTDPMTISEHMRNYYTEMLENNSHSAEDIQEWLNQSPYITLRLVNNSYESLLKEAGHHPTDFDRYITRNTLEYHTSTDVCVAQYIARLGQKSNP